MTFNWTNEQKSAISLKTPVLVSAAAGSGKTAVLVERVIKILTDRENPVSADRLLIVTFTNAAAAEMLARIEARLHEEHENDPKNEHINRQLYLMKSADICTIDSFCIRLLRENFALAGIEPDFRVTDDNSLYSKRSEVLKETLNEYLENRSEDFNLLLELAGCKFGEDRLVEIIDSIYTDSLKKPFAKAYRDSIKLPYSVPFEQGNIWYDYAFSTSYELIANCKKCVEKMAEAALYCEMHDKATEYAEVTANVIADIEEALNSGVWDSVFEVARSAKLGNLPKNCGDALGGYKTEILAQIERIRQYFYDTKSSITAEIFEQSSAIKLLFEIIDKYSDALFSRLKQDNTFSFDDVEQLAMKMLAFLDENGNTVKTEWADEVISRYDHVLVDEFQDVNDLQNTLFEILSDGGRKLFIVGDVKQSIYAFRGSNPDIFLKKKDEYKDYSAVSEHDKKRVLLLNNYRSRKGICDSVNYFFERIMTGKVGKLVYDESEMLKPDAEFPENGVSATDFLVVDKVDDEGQDSLIESEANAICNYIKETMASGCFLRGENGTLRAPRYGDFCILLATLKEKAGVIADRLCRQGIPAKVNDGNFFESTEVVTALSILHTVNNPQNDVYLLRTLMSPVFGFTAEEMADVRTDRKDISLYAALCEYADGSIKAQNFLSEMSDYRKMSCMLPTNKFLAYIIDKTDMMNIFYSLPDGDLRADNLMALMRLADEYTGDMSGSVFGFLRYMESLPENAVKVSGGTNDDCVKIMSIHGSKGLQFPICIVAGMSNRINKSDSYETCLYSGDFGIGFKYYDRKSGDKSETLGHKVLSGENLKRTVQERLRLLYVAMTRAEEKLCLVCCLNNAASTLLSAAGASDNGYADINAGYIMRAQNSAQYILAAAIIHPDADVLRKVAECKVKICDTECRINFKIIDAAKTDNAHFNNVSAPLPDSDLAQKISRNIAYKYPYEAFKNIPAKTSVSAMANKAEAEQYAFSDRPGFMEKDGVSAAGRGTVVHKIMQYIDFSAANIESEIARLINEKRITQAQADAVSIDKVKAFFESDIKKRIMVAKEIRREMRFLTELPVSYYKKNASQTDDKFIVQGAVDLCFAEPDGVVVLDFKTDKADTADELKNKYAEQLNIYAKACEKIFSLPVKEKIIYSFSLSREIRI